MVLMPFYTEDAMSKKLRKTSIIYIMLAFTLILLISSCKPAAPVEPTLDANMIFTQAAETVAFQLTSTALSMPTATETPKPTPTETEVPPTATATQVVTQGTIVATSALTVAPNPNKMEFISDVTIPDGQIIPSGSKFIKTWKVKNVGNTTWKNTYKIRLYAGDLLGASSANILLGKEVKPNEETDISIEFTAPAKSGEYYSMWILSDETEANFGVPFYVKFVVGVPASATPTTTSPATSVPATATSTTVPTATPTS
jgi:hypothetical protein